MYVYPHGDCGGQKRASNLLELELPMVVSHHVGKWKLNPWPTEEQSVLVTSESSLLLNRLNY